MYVVGGIRATFYIGVEAGGPAAYWSVSVKLFLASEN